MMNRKAAGWVLAGALGLGTGGSAVAQAEPTYGCSGPEAAQFDFWVGEWDVIYQDEGKEARSRNTVTKLLDNCVIHEDFRGSPGSKLNGRSYSTFDRATRKWKQTWVDNTASYLDFEGGFAEGRMILSRNAVGRDGKSFLQRMVWFDIKPDSFSWHWERSDDLGASWKVNWAIQYRRAR